MILDFFLLADEASVSSGKVFIHGGGFTQLSLPAMPLTVPQIHGVARFILEESDHDPCHIAAEWRQVDAGPIAPRIEGEVDPNTVTSVADEERALYLVIKFTGLCFDAPGKFELLISLDGELVGRRELLVLLAREGTADMAGRFDA